MHRAFAAFIGIAIAAGPAPGQPPDNLAVNPGAEVGVDPWTLDVNTHHAAFVTSLGFVLLSASEGFAFFYTDRTQTSDGITASGVAYQTIDVRGLGPIESVTYGGDLAHIADVLAGSGAVGMRSIAFVEFRDAADQFLGTASSNADEIDPTAGFTAFADLRYETTEVPVDTAFIVFGLGDNIRLQSDSGMQLEVRFVTRIDDAFLTVTVPEGGSAAGGVVAIAALLLGASARGRRHTIAC